jgi:hypothetical protein
LDAAKLGFVASYRLLLDSVIPAVEPGNCRHLNSPQNSWIAVIARSLFAPTLVSAHEPARFGFKTRIRTRPGDQKRKQELKLLEEWGSPYLAT